MNTRALVHVPEPQAAPLIDLGKIYMALRRRQWWILGTLLIVFALTAFAYLRSTPLYGASATVALDRKSDELVAGQDAGTGDAGLIIDSPTVDTAVQVLTSTRLAGGVVDQLGLARVVGFGQVAGAPAVPLPLARTRAINVVLSTLVVRRVGVSYAISVAFQHSDPTLTARVVNTVVDRYIADQRGLKVGNRDQQVQLIGDRLQRLRQDVIRGESAEAGYRARNNLINVQKDSTSVQQELSVLNGQLANAQADEAAARAKLNAVNASGRSPSADSAASSTIGSLRVQQAQLSAQRADLAERYGPLHPDLARIDEQLAAVNRSIATESSRVRSELLTDVRQASGRTQAVQGSLGRAQGGLSAGNAASVQLNELVRNADSARSLYQAFLDRYRQAVAGQGTDRSDAYVIAHAMAPRSPQSPLLWLFVAGGLVAGLLAAALVVLLLEALENGFQTRQQVERTLGLPVIASIPDLRKTPGVGTLPRGDMGPPDYLIGHEGSVFGEAFRAIRTDLRVGHADQTVRTVAICSPLPNEGKTTTAICLARSAALAGHNVVLVDCDIRRRASSRAMTKRVDTGLIEVLQGTATLDDALIRDDATGLLILAQSSAGSAGYDLLTSDAMERLVAALGKQYDLVVLDTAPILPLAEARAVASMADMVLMITRWRKTPVRAAELAHDMLLRSGAQVRGVLLSLVDVRAQARSGAGDEMLYYKKYREYYS